MTSGAHEPTGDSRATVKAMSAYGIPQDAICAVLDISKPTLHKYYRREIDTGTAQANAKVAETLYKRATGGGPQDVAAMIFWLKARAGWSERVQVDHQSSDGSLRPTRIVIEAVGLDDETDDPPAA